MGGSEVDVMPDLIFTGGLEHVNNIMVEWHERLEKLPERKKAQQQLESIIKLLSEYSQTMKGRDRAFKFNLVKLDNEVYHKLKCVMPEC